MCVIAIWMQIVDDGGRKEEGFALEGGFVLIVWMKEIHLNLEGCLIVIHL